MRALQNVAVSAPQREFLVAFSVHRRTDRTDVQRTVRVLAQTPEHARRICMERYPAGSRCRVVEHVT